MNSFKLTRSYQKKWNNNHLFNQDVVNNISPDVQLHKEIHNVLSSAASCLNLFGNLNEKELLNFLNRFDLQIQEIIPFPSKSNVDGQIYDDIGNVIFEWIGPKKSPINERGGKRGQNRTSIDAFVLARIEGKITQLLIEWKFTESYNSVDQTQKFSGIAGTERLRRYSAILAKLRKKKDIPFSMKYEGGWGLSDLGYEPYYQLLRMTLLGKMTSPFQLNNNIMVEDYRIIHLSHSDNNKLNIVTKKMLNYCPGIIKLAGLPLHQIWKEHILTDVEAKRFKYGYWNKNIDVIMNEEFKKYMTERYE